MKKLLNLTLGSLLLVAVFSFIGKFNFIKACSSTGCNNGAQISHMDCSEILVVYDNAPNGLDGTTATALVKLPNNSQITITSNPGFHPGNSSTEKWSFPSANWWNGDGEYSVISVTLPNNEAVHNLPYTSTVNNCGVTPSPTPPVCQQESWTCEQCLVPLSENDQCARDQKNYCEQTYDCHMDAETRIVTCNCSNPTPTPTPEPTEEPSPTPNPEVSPSPSPVDEKSAKIGYDINCTRSYFIATLDLSENGNWSEGVKVTFKYNGSNKEDYTDAQGRARVEFDIAGEHPLTASADGFDTQSIDIKVPICDGSDENKEKSSGEVLGTSTDTPRRGQVLGASTLANTGSKDNFYWMMIVAGAVLSISAGLSYVKSK